LKELDTTASRRLDIAALRDQLDTRLFGVGDRLVYVPRVDSTNIVAMRLARLGAEDGTVVITDNQTAGKGRLGRSWLDREGDHALSSLVMRPSFQLYLLVMMAALSVVETIGVMCGIDATIKWPNDVLIGSRKVAGILIETSYDRSRRLVAIVGIGVNVNGCVPQQVEPVRPHVVGHQAESPVTAFAQLSTATTLETECGHLVSREIFVARLLHCVESYYLALQQEAGDSVAVVYGSASHLVREQWRNRLSTLGRSIEVRQGDTLLSGVAEDVNDNGELLLRCYSGSLFTITWGDIGYPPA
jgi:BirA family biotin operon repressor/biotin-[acetyl-CoA-carboxylase] ligase